MGANGELSMPKRPCDSQRARTPDMKDLGTAEVPHVVVKTMPAAQGRERWSSKEFQPNVTAGDQPFMGGIATCQRQRCGLSLSRVLEALGLIRSMRISRGEIRRWVGGR